VNNKFWESVKPGDDIHVICHPSDRVDLEEMLKSFDLAVKTFGPFKVTISSYVEQGTVLFINKSYNKFESRGWPDWARDLKFVGLLHTSPFGIIKTDVL
jgi:hypothetical protein